MKKVLFLMLLAVVVISSVSFAAEFSDISGHWAKQYVTELADKGVINGYEDGTFKPEGEIKKGEFLKLIMCASLPDADFTTDTPKYNHWADGYIEMAEFKGVIDDGWVNETTANEVITRREMVYILGKCDILLKEYGLKSGPVELFDIDDMSADEIKMLSHCVSRGLIAGYEDYTFRPDKTLTRAEVATIIWRFMQ